MCEIEISKKVKITKHFDVIVVGSGPSGICAAVSSARQGAKTAIVERYGLLGGNLTIGHVTPVMGKVGDGTIADEMESVICKEIFGKFAGHDIEKAKTRISNWVSDAGVNIFLQAPVVDVIMEENAIRGIVVGGKSGLEAMTADVIIDATGDGTVSFLAGGKIEQGRDGDALLQPVTLMFSVAGVDEGAAISPGNHTYDVRMPGSDFRKRCEEAAKNGLLPEYASFVRLYRSHRKGECVINATQENFINALEFSDMTKAEISLRNQIEPICDYLRKNVKGFENCYVCSSASTLGIRETRRVIGEYVLTEEDVLYGKRFEDVVVHRAEFIIDIHNPTGGGQADERRVVPYDIPYRCLVPLEIDNLLTVGRCISGTHHAHASYRVMRICMATGQVGGIAAAIASKKQIVPRDVDYKEIQTGLQNAGAKLFD